MLEAKYTPNQDTSSAKWSGALQGRRTPRRLPKGLAQGVAPRTLCPNQIPEQASASSPGALVPLEQFSLASELRLAVYEKRDIPPKSVSFFIEDPDPHLEGLAVPIVARNRLLP